MRAAPHRLVPQPVAAKPAAPWRQARRQARRGIAGRVLLVAVLGLGCGDEAPPATTAPPTLEPAGVRPNGAAPNGAAQNGAENSAPVGEAAAQPRSGDGAEAGAGAGNGRRPVREVTAADVNPDEPLEDEAVPVLAGPSEEELAEEEEPAPGGGRVVLGHGLREVDREAFSWQGRTLRSEKVHDATKSKKTPYKINVYRDPGHTTVTRLRIDLDRDDRWDEKWTFDGEAVRRLIAPQDDEHYTQTFTWAGNGWAAAD